MMIDADFSFFREWWLVPSLPERERDDEHLFKPMGSLEDSAFFEHLICTVNGAQNRDAEGELRLYPPMGRAQISPSSRQRRLDPGSRL